MCFLHRLSQISGTAQQLIDFEVMSSVHSLTETPTEFSLYIDLHTLRAQSSISAATAPNES